MLVIKAKLFFYTLFLVSIMFSVASATNFPFPQEVVYPNGIQTKNFLSEQIQDKYDFFLDRYYEEQGSLARIKFEDPPKGTADETVSEGIAYGMLIMVYMDNQENNTKQKFDRLWNYYKNFMNHNGVMNWHIRGFNQVIGNGGAADAEVDAAAALVLAYYQWGDENYRNDARSLINAIHSHEVESNLLVAGDQWNQINPSYMSIAAFRLFKKVDTNPSRWDAVIDRCYRLLEDSQNRTTGLYPDWCNTDGSPNNTHGTGGNFFYDAVRTPWRMSWDYAWSGDTRARSLNSRTSSWANQTFGDNPGRIRDGYTLNGSVMNDATNNNATFVGAFTSAFMVDNSYQERLDGYYSYLANLFSSRDSYFGNTLKILYMLLITGNMPDFSNMDSFDRNSINFVEDFSLSSNSINFNNQELRVSAVFNRAVRWYVTFTGETSGATVEFYPASALARDYSNEIDFTFVASDIDAEIFRDGETVNVELRYLNVDRYETVQSSFVIEETYKYLIGEALIDDFISKDLTSYLQTQWSYSSQSSSSSSIEEGVFYNRDALKISHNGGSESAKTAAYIGFDPDGNAIDVRDIQAIVYFYKGDAHTLRFISEDTQDDDGHYQIKFEASQDWTMAVGTKYLMNKPVGSFNISNIPSAFSLGKGLEWVVDGVGEKELYLDMVFVPPLDINPVSVKNNSYSLSEIDNKDLKVYPNPFNPVCNISFYIKNESVASSISIYSIDGRLVKEFNISEFGYGRNSVVFDGTNRASGIYFVKYVNGDNIKINQVVLLK